MRTSKLYYTIFLTLFFLAAESSIAQVTWMRPGSNSLSAEYRDAIGLEDGESSGYLLLLNGRYQFTPTIQSMIQIPISYASFPSGLFMENNSSFYIGNLFFGIECGRQTRSSGILQAGLRLPTASVNDFAELLAASYGTTLAFEQFEAYYPKMMAMQVAGGYQVVNLENDVTGLVWKTILGGTFMKPEDVDGEFFGDFNTAVWFYTTHARFGIGGITRAILTEDVDDLGDRFSTQIGASIVGVFGHFRPSVGVVVPLSETLRDQYDFTFSIGLGVDFGIAEEGR